MRNVSREELLLAFEEKMDDIFDGKNRDILKKVIRFNLVMLNNIEKYFLIDSFNERTPYGKEIDIVLQIENNISSLGSIEAYGKFAKQTIDQMHFYLWKMQNKYDKYYVFNQLIHLLSKYNNENMQYISLNKFEQLFPYNPKTMTKVFLSYAFDDRLYSFNLFCYLYTQGIYLYVDWMHNNKIDNGILLKSTLKKEITTSSQLLFLRTSNSELNIKGNKGVRPWCSWELGVFYEFGKKDEKYLLSLYSIDKYKNLQLHGMKEANNIIQKRITGKLIIK